MPNDNRAGQVGGAEAQPALTGGDPPGKAAPRKPGRGGSRKVRNPGWRAVNEYPLDGDEVWELAFVRWGLNRVFHNRRLAARPIYRVFLRHSLQLPAYQKKQLANGRGPLWWSSRVGIACLIVGALFVAAGGYKAFRIYWSTTH